MAIPGFPFGSLVQYAFDDNGDLILYLAKIAQHTRNVAKDDKVSITVIEDEKTDIQQAGRVTILGHLRPYEDQKLAADIYFRFFPESIDYQDKMHDFHFYRLTITKVRFIGGFGDINWVSKENFMLTRVFDKTDYNEVINHMNEDHVAAMKDYCYLYNIVLNDQHSPSMSGFDSEGMWLQVGIHNHYIAFD